MKRLFLLTIALMTTIFTCDAAMTKSRVRKEARFLTDKMAYELNLSNAQYNDVYEINYDFIHEVNYIMDDVLDGFAWALDDYYYLLDMRNDDLRWVLSSGQYRRMMDIDYFYRPIYMASNDWTFRVHIHYTNFNHFYFPKPHHYKSYVGGHARHHWNDISFYKDRHHGIAHHPAPEPIRHNEVTYRDSRKSDFGSIKVRPNTEKRNTTTTTSRRKSSNDDTYSVPAKKETRPAASRRATSTSTTNKDVNKNTRTTERNKRTETTTTKKENNSNRASGSNVRSSSSRSNSNSSTSTRSSSSSSRNDSGSSRSNSGSSRSRR